MTTEREEETAPQFVLENESVRLLYNAIFVEKKSLRPAFFEMLGEKEGSRQFRFGCPNSQILPLVYGQEEFYNIEANVELPPLGGLLHLDGEAIANPPEFPLTSGFVDRKVRTKKRKRATIVSSSSKKRKM